MPLGPHPKRATGKHRALRVRARSIVLAFSFAVWLMVGSGCVLTPLRSKTDAPAPLPQVPEGARSPEVAAGIEQAGKKTDFHAMPTDRQSFQVHIDFGRVFESQGNYDAALQEYQEALTVVDTRQRGSLGPADSALAQRRMAGAFDRLGRFAQAEVHYEKALKLAPREPKVWNDVGYSYYLQGRWSDAERALKTAATLAPDDDRIRTNLGLTLAAAGKTNEAFPLLSQSTGDATGHANLGYLLAATGQFDLARRQYETALALRPDMQIAQRALARLDRQQHSSGVDSAANTMLATTTRAIADPVDREVKPAAAATIKIPPPRNWSLPPGAPAPASLSAPARTQTALPGQSDPSRLPPPI